MCMGSLFITATLAFSAGEQCTRVYKNRFYLELGNFIDEFTEWDAKAIKSIEPNKIEVIARKTPKKVKRANKK